MVAAAHPLAAEAGLQVLRDGGSAVDAAVAVQMVLNVVEPQSSGIGGGAFLMLWDGREVQAWDGRETAPAAADAAMFLRADGTPAPFAEAQFGGRAVGTPGVVRMLEAVHGEHGQLPWARLVAPAITLAEQGVPVGERLHRQLAGDPLLRRDARARAFWYRDDGTPHPVGHRLRNPALAQVLRAVAQQGSAALHEGPIAQAIVADVQGHAVSGRLSLQDLAGYRALRRAPLCSDWAPHWRVCGFPPPSSGHLALMQMLGIVDALPGVPNGPAALTDGVPGPDWLHAYTEAARLAYADRARFVADPDFVAAPGGDWNRLLAPAYLARRAALVGPRSLGQAAPGDPGATTSALADMPAQPEAGTSHVSIVDRAGRAVALTTTIEAQFGARVLSDGGSGLPGGFLLNNQLTDFALAPSDAQGRPVANRIEPGKRPRSSMGPTLVFDRRDGRLVMSLGSPGGAAIPHFVAKQLVGTLRWGLDPQQAAALPNFGSFNGPTVLERARFPAATLQALQERGHGVQEAELTSGLQAIRRTPRGWAGGADPRREGAVRGD
ncbi:MAG: gamma-glutamyltransferase family protein [Rubrivivax sp.]|nr:gamma-glutamyltransferase family protein [Rubrivivax sp.]